MAAGGSLRAVRSEDAATITLPNPDVVAEADLPAVLLQLAAWQARGAARLIGRRPRLPDRLLDAEETAARLRTTVDWLSRQKTLPFRVVIGPAQVRYSEQGLDDWISGRRGGGP